MAERKSRAKAEQKEKQVKYQLVSGKWSIKRAHQFDNGNICFDMQINAVTFYRMMVIQAKDGTEFISFPQYQSNGKWYNYFYIPFEQEDVDKIIDEVYNTIDD